MPNLLTEHFADLPIAVIGGDYTPSGEYHIVPTLTDTGRWREVMIHHSFRRQATSRGNWQVVENNDSSRSLEQTIVSETWPPMLATGSEEWIVHNASVDLHPLTKSGRRGLVFRYRHASDYAAAIVTDNKLQVVRYRYGQEQILAEGDVTVDLDRTTTLTITQSETDIVAGWENVELRVSLDESSAGGIALIADHPTRFQNVKVEGHTAPVAGGSVVIDERVRPYVWRKLRTPDFGTDRNLRVGDLNGDGQPELVVARRTDRLGGDNFSSISSLAAFDLDGNLLWSWGTPSENTYATTSDLCFQVHDWDGDGKAEVVFCRDADLIHLDGATGTVIRRMTLPENPPGGRSPLYRMLGDSLHFADLTGSGRPDSLLLKDRYENVWAYDKDLNFLWHWAGNSGHFPYTKDIDGDGKDEVMIGHSLLDDDGTELWHTPYEDHSDNVMLMNLHTPNGLQQRSLIAGSDAGLIMLDQHGTEVMRFPIGHAQSMCIGNLMPDRPGLEFMCNTFWGRVGVNATFSEQGELLCDFEPMPYASLLQLANWVPAASGQEPADLALLSTHPVQGGLIDGYGVRRVMFPDDGHPVLCSAVYDLDKDGIDEILTWDENEIWIYKADVPGRNRDNYPLRSPDYNESNYRAQVSIPVGQGDVR